jgi:hypothetical protein
MNLLCVGLNRLFSIIKIDSKCKKDFDIAISQTEAEMEVISDSEVQKEPSTDAANEQKEEFFDDGDDALPKMEPILRNTAQDVVYWKPAAEDEKYVYLNELSAIQAVAARHSVAEFLKPYLEKVYAVDKLKGITQEPKKNIWSSLFKRSKPKNKEISNQELIEAKIFGTDLHLLVEKYSVESTYGFGNTSLRIPILMQECISHLKRHGIIYLNRFNDGRDISKKW